MMKQHLWALNTSLLCILILAIVASLGLQTTAPRHRAITIPPPRVVKVSHVPSLEELYGPRDLFGLFVKPTAPAVKPLEIPKPPQFSPPPMPQVPKNSALKLAPPLAISLSGIIFSPHRIDRSVVMIADETNKETLYHLGDRIKDGMIIKIAQDLIVILRSNGQQETFYLRKDITLDALNSTDKNGTGAEKVALETGENAYELSKEIFTRKIKSVGDVLQEFDLMPLYVQGNIKGFNIGAASPESFAGALGFKANDVVTKINEFDLAEISNRVKAYEALSQPKLTKPIVISFLRDNKEQKKTITVLEKHKTKTLSSMSPGKKASEFERPAQKSNQPMTERSYNEMIDTMRNQLAENMRSRAYAQRVQ
jgi:type II secretory pathway component PulC